MVKKIKHLLTGEILIIFFLIFTAITSHIEWFNPFSILAYSDWQFRTNEHVSQLFTSWQSWIGFEGLGSANVIIFGFPLRGILWSYIVNLGLNYDIAVKLTLLIPIALGSVISPYIYIKSLTKDLSISFAAALFYCSTIYFLVVQQMHLPIAFIYAFLPLIIFIFNWALHKNNLISWIILTIVFTTGVFYEVRVMLIVAFILSLIFMFQLVFYFRSYNLKKVFINISISAFIYLLINSFWILPSLFGIRGSIEDLASRYLFGNNLFDIARSFTIMKWEWTGGALNGSFVAQPIPLYVWFIPIIIFLGFSLTKNYKKESLLFLFLTLIGIFLTKQTGQPFSETYEFLRENLPGFVIFREASKFYIITSFGYLGLLSYSLLYLKNSSSKQLNTILYKFVLAVVIIVSFLNLSPLISRKIEGLLVPRIMNEDYKKLNSFIYSQGEYFRTLWMPRDSKWGIYLEDKPKVSSQDMVYSKWSNFSAREDNSTIFTEDKIMSVFNQSYSGRLFDLSSIKYVVVPLNDPQNGDDFYSYLGLERNKSIRDEYINFLASRDYLKKIDIGTEHLVVFENADFRPHIYITNEEETIKADLPYKEIDSKKINPNEYRIKLTGVKDVVYINFSESFDSEWKVKIGNFNWFNSLMRKNYYLPEIFHIKNDAGLNAFKIDPEYIKTELNKKDFTINKDGSLDLDIVIFYKPQALFILGGIISAISLISISCMLLIGFIRRK